MILTSGSSDGIEKSKGSPPGPTEKIMWKVDYNENRPHSSLGNLTPEQFRQQAELKIQNQREKLRSIGKVNLAAVS